MCSSALVLLLLKGSAVAQAKDSLQLFREFIDVNSSFKAVPLQMSVTFRQFNNLVSADSIKQFNGDFFINKNGAYIDFGPMEQLVNDTMVLVVMKDNKQMLLSQNKTPVADYLRSVTMQPLHDTDARKAASIFTIKKTKKENNTSELEILTRNCIEEGLPNMSLHLLYDNDSKKPLHLTMVKRTLGKLPADSGSFKKGIVNGRIKITSVEGKGNCIVKEDTSDITYTKIEGESNVLFPVLIKDRIYQNAEGDFEPVKEYAGYHLINHFRQ